MAGNFIPVGHGDDRYLILEKTINDQFMATQASVRPARRSSSS